MKIKRVWESDGIDCSRHASDEPETFRTLVQSRNFTRLPVCYEQTVSLSLIETVPIFVARNVSFTQQLVKCKMEVVCLCVTVS